jgi:hypothetical protein
VPFSAAIRRYPTPPEGDMLSDVDEDETLRSTQLASRDKMLTLALGGLMVLVVPFFVTGLFRLGLSGLLVLPLCLAVAGALAAVPRRGGWLALGWLLGCVLWAVALAFVAWQFGQGMAEFE